MADNRPIGVFDSGLGGLTVLKELRLALPEEDFVYFGDTGRVPYGGRSSETITRYAREDAAFLLKNDVKLIVAACGTVSSICGETLKQELPVPFAGVVEHGARAAAQATKNGKIGILGTKGTIKSGAYERYLSKFAPDAVCFSKACPMFVPLVENGYTKADDPVGLLVAEEYLAPLKEAGVDTLIMGCTHYPFLRQLLQRVMGENVTLIDVGQTTAAYVKEILAGLELTHSGQKQGSTALYASDDLAHMSDFAASLLGEGLSPVQRVNL